MRRSARELRAEAVRLSDPAYRAKQIAENRARGNVITDAELRDVGASLPAKADDLERQAEHLAAEARKPTCRYPPPLGTRRRRPEADRRARQSRSLSQRERESM
jgi:hypothetical protein